MSILSKIKLSGLRPGKRKPIVSKNLPGRNEPCRCGSKIKYKNCHWAQDQK